MTAVPDFSTARYNAEVLWRIRKSTTGQVDETRWGSSTLGDFFAAADYDGDGKSDIAVFRGGEWHILESSTGNYRYDVREPPETHRRRMILTATAGRI